MPIFIPLVKKYNLRKKEEKLISYSLGCLHIFYSESCEEKNIVECKIFYEEPITISVSFILKRNILDFLSKSDDKEMRLLCFLHNTEILQSCSLLVRDKVIQH